MSYAEIKAFKVPVTCPSSIKERKKNGALDHGVENENTLCCCEGFCKGCFAQIITFEHQADAVFKSRYVLLQISTCRPTLGGKP